jgi:hypothetical protein
VAFVFVQARTRAPMMPLGLFKSRDFVGTNLLTLLLYFALSGALFFLPFVLIGAFKYSATAELITAYFVPLQTSSTVICAISAPPLQYKHIPQRF